MLRIAVFSSLTVLLLCSASFGQSLDAHWTFDNDFSDSTANGHNGTATGGAVIDNANSKIGGGAVSLDGGTSSYVTATGYKGRTGTAARTVSAWIKMDQPIASPPGDVNQGIFGWGTNSGGQKWTVRTQNSNGLSGALRTEVNGGYIVGTTALDDGNWHHVAVTFEDDGSPNVRDVLLYVDGQLDAAFGGSPAPSASKAKNINTASGSDVGIGRRQGNTNDNFDGLIDDAGVFTEALSAEKVAAIFSLGANGDLGYDLRDDDALFALYDAGQKGDPTDPVEVNGLTWDYVDSGLAGNPGEVTGSGVDFSLLLDPTNGAGLQTVAQVVPEPASIAIWSLIGLGLAGFGFRRFRHKT